MPPGCILSNMVDACVARLYNSWSKSGWLIASNRTYLLNTIVLYRSKYNYQGKSNTNLTRAVVASKKEIRTWFSSSLSDVPCSILCPATNWYRCCFSCHASSDRSSACDNWNQANANRQRLTKQLPGYDRASASCFCERCGWVRVVGATPLRPPGREHLRHLG